MCTGASPFVPPFAHPDGRRRADDAAGVRAARPARAPGRAGRRADRMRVRRLLLALRLARHAVSARDQLLPNDDPDLAEVLEEVFLRRGMDVVENGRAAAIDTEDPEAVRLVLEDGRESDVLPRAALHRHAPQHARSGPRVGGRRVRRAGHAARRRVLPHERRPHLRLRRRHRPDDARQHGRHARPHGRAARARHRPIDPVAYTGVAWCVFTRPEIAKAGHLRAPGAARRHPGAGDQAPDPRQPAGGDGGRDRRHDQAHLRSRRRAGSWAARWSGSARRR